MGVVTQKEGYYQWGFAITSPVWQVTGSCSCSGGWLPATDVASGSAAARRGAPLGCGWSGRGLVAEGLSPFAGGRQGLVYNPQPVFRGSGDHEGPAVVLGAHSPSRRDGHDEPRGRGRQRGGRRLGGGIEELEGGEEGGKQHAVDAPNAEPRSSRLPRPFCRRPLTGQRALQDSHELPEQHMGAPARGISPCPPRFMLLVPRQVTQERA
mmetsp:Transcript_85660/g.218418  ORF Transcript_85660/g.218418 Transcript_85660/m.218418 type:complete len:209 (-) Transcript_85660:49-675(-)